MERLEPYTDFEIQQQINNENLHYELKEKEMKTAQIESCAFKQSWQTKRGDTMHTHIITLSDGVTGEINAKSQMPDFLKEGETLHYAMETTTYGNKITRIQPKDPDTPSHGAFKAGQNWEDPDRQKKIIRQSCLAQAVQMLKDTATDKKMITDLAEYFETWVNR